MEFLQYFINGISIGSVYAMIALGYTMVYGIAKVLNFAHGDVIMVGGYICFCATVYWGLPTVVGILLAMIVCTILGVLIERLAYRPLRGTSSLAILITAIGVSCFLQNGAQLIWGSDPKSFTSIVTFLPFKIFHGSVTITGEMIVTMIASAIIMVALSLFTGKTKMGKSMRAVAENKEAAKLMGINVNRTISVTFAIGWALAAIAGVLLCSTISTLQPTTGSMPGTRALTAAVFGGIGSIPGAMLGGILLGLIETFSKIYISTQFSDAVVFLVLIVVLLVKPCGLLGKTVQEKV